MTGSYCCSPSNSCPNSPTIIPWSDTMRAATKEQMAAFNELQRLSASPESAARYLEAVGSLDVRGLLSQVKAPTLVMHVRSDRLIHSDLGRELAAGIPGARFVALPGKN